MENICQAHHCENVIRGRRKDAKYCSESCKQVQKRYIKENGLTPSSSIGSASKRRFESTGSLFSDASIDAAIGLMSNGSKDPVSTVTDRVMGACMPYAITTVKNRPFLSMASAFAGYKIASELFKSCTTTIVERENAPNDISKTCSPASPLHKTGSAAVAVLAVNYLLDQFISFSDASSDTGLTRVIPVSDTDNTGSDTPKSVFDRWKADDISFFKAN